MSALERPLSASLTLQASAQDARSASEWLARVAAGSVPEEDIGRLDLCLNEALANVIAHGGASAATQPILLTLEVHITETTGEASLTLSDAGPAFDMTSAPLKAQASSLADAMPGGLGLLMLRKFSNDLHYQRVVDRNLLTITVRWVPPLSRLSAQNTRLFKDRQERRGTSVPRVPERRRQERRNEALEWIPIFRDVSPVALRAALADCEVLELPAGTQLLTPGEYNHNVFIALTGNVVVRLNNGPDGTADIAIASGECVGELSAIDGKPVSALVLAQTNVRVLKISSEVFWDGLMTMPHIARNLQRSLTERLRRTNEIALKAQRERLELAHLRKELTVATQLQASMLPLQRPIFQERPELDVCGFMEPASSVGGDLFDAFFVDDDVLFFCIGDVSGHGVASALFMARAIGLLRLLAINTSEPQQLLRELNERLCIANETNIFLTIFCGFYDVRRGALSYSNGGHCPPLLLGPHGARFLPVPKGPLIGAFEGVVFGNMQTTLQPGELLFCYTDGVTEAQAPAGQEYSEERCIRLLEANGQRPLSELLDVFRKDVQRFTSKSVLDDDCTMLALRRTVLSP